MSFRHLRMTGFDKTSARVIQPARVVINRGDFGMLFAKIPNGQIKRATVRQLALVELPGVFPLKPKTSRCG